MVSLALEKGPEYIALQCNGVVVVVVSEHLGGRKAGGCGKVRVVV